MAPKGISVRFLAVMVVAASTTVAAPAAWSQGDGGRSGDRVQPPTELLREYPFHQGRLESRDGRRDTRLADARSSQPPLAERAPGEGGEGGWLWIWVVLGLATLVSLVLIRGRVLRPSAGGRGHAPDAAPAPPSPTVASREPPRSPAARGHRSEEGPPPKNSYAIVNQKGGVGKTTVSLALGAAAARRGSRVLLLDLDPQASATSVLGADADDRPTLTEVMLGGDSQLGQAVRPTGWGLDLAPANRGLRAADTGMAMGDEPILRRKLRTVGEYDLTLMDCPPNLGTLTINALAAASRAVIVTEPTFLALHAMEELLDTLRDVAAEQNPSLELAGVVLNRVETTAEHKQSVAEVEETFGSKVWEPHVPRRAILQDAMRRGVPPQELKSHSHYATEIAEIFDALAGRIEAIQVKS
jgi:chromosome partitioning protein